MALLSVALPAQQVLLRAPSIEAAWCGGDGLFRAQAGRRVVVFETPPRSVAIPDDAVAFDHLGCLAWSTAASFHASTTRPTSLGGGFALRAQEGPPLRVASFAGPRHVVVAMEDGVRAVDLVTGKAADLGVTPRHTRDPAYGLSGQVLDALTVPHVLAFEHAGGLVALLQEPGGGYVCADGARRRALPAVDLTEGGAIEGFEFPVPPLLADLDEDGVPDLVRTDPVRGVVVVQGGLLDAAMPSPRVIALKTPVLLVDAADMTGDGAAELVVLKLPLLTPLQQLSIVMTSRVDATLLVYDLARAPGAAPAPVATIDVTLGVKIIVRDAVRRADLQDLVACAAGKVLLATPGGRARILGLDGKETLGGMVPPGAWAEPLRPARHGSVLCGVLVGAKESALVRFDL